ncbi:MAG: glycosyltransferase family 2 protein [Chitinispirillaceae bacterium]|nr:glycosyltransferase family 2 protein [Chitinispirillaceae bacterium]
MGADTLPVSICMITRNEERKLAQSLQSVSWADEVVIVDDFSTDATATVAATFPNVSLIRHALVGFGHQRKYAASLAHNDWTFTLDADEVFTPELKDEVAAKVHDRSDTAAYRVRRKNLHFKKFHVDTNFGSIRLFRKSLYNYKETFVHENVDVHGPVLNLSGLLLHYPTSFESYRKHFEICAVRYGKMGGLEYYHRGRRIRFPATVWKIWGFPAAVFFWKLFRQQYFRRGMDGVCISLCSGISYHLSYKELYRLQKEGKK